MHRQCELAAFHGGFPHLLQIETVPTARSEWPIRSAHFFTMLGTIAMNSALSFQTLPPPPPARAHHVIYFASPQAWLQYPEWARYRHDQIIARIKSAFHRPDYEYDGDGSGTAGRRSS